MSIKRLHQTIATRKSGMNLRQEGIKYLETADTSAANSFYRTVGYGGGCNPGDRLLVARECQRIVAAVRLCEEEGIRVLRGMYVTEDRRGQGIGSKLLESADGAIGGSECWCVPYEHLADFYSRIGFREHTVESAPKFLTERRSRYLARGHVVTIMRRPAG